jgi:hypothetical protein
VVPTKGKDDETISQALRLKQQNLYSQYDWHTNINVFQMVFRGSIMIMKSGLDLYMALDGMPPWSLKITPT